MVNTRSKTKKIQALVFSNDDLLTEILLRLPVTSILRFKSVSKHWRWLLSDRSFTLRFDKLSKSPGMFAGNKYVPFDVEPQSPPPFRTLDFCHDPYGIKILQSCNGLLLCSSDGWNPFAEGPCKYYVFNPTTKQFAIIPTVPGIPRKAMFVFMRLAFHQTGCPHYKLVCFLPTQIKNALEPSESYQIQIFSSETWTWKISIESFSPGWLYFSAVYWNGAIHWCPSNRTYSYFNVETEQFHTIPLTPQMGLPGYQHRSRVPLYFGESRGHLHLIEATYSLHLKVFEMSSDRSGWFFKYQVELDEVAGAFPEMELNNRLQGYIFCVCDLVRGEQEEEDSFMVLGVPGKMIKYNVHDKSFEQIFSINDKLDVRTLTAHRYIESLAPL